MKLTNRALSLLIAWLLLCGMLPHAAIGNDAFWGCTSLTSIVIPDSVTSVGRGAFLKCTSLNDIYCKAESQPEGWDADWQFGCYVTVHWG